MASVVARNADAASALVNVKLPTAELCGGTFSAVVLGSGVHPHAVSTITIPNGKIGCRIGEALPKKLQAEKGLTRRCGPGNLATSN